MTSKGKTPKKESKSKIIDEERSRSSQVLAALIDFFASEEWIVPICSFIDEYCLIFSPDLSHDTLKEKQRIFHDYKQLINGMLDSFLKDHDMSRQYLQELLVKQAHKISSDTFNYLLAVEDFEAFTAFMSERNQQLNILTVAKLEKKKKEQEKLLRKIQRAQTLGALGDTKKLDLTEREMLDLALQQSQDEEKRRKRREEDEEAEMLRKVLEQSELESKRKQQEEEKEEEMLMKLALQASLRSEEERALAEKEKRLKEEHASQEAKEIPKLSSNEQESVPLLSARSQQQSQQAFRIKNTKVRPMVNHQLPLQKAQTGVKEKVEDKPSSSFATQKPSESEKMQQQESLEERQKRLKTQRDALKKKGQTDAAANSLEEVKQDSLPSDHKERERLNRCLNVLREAANDMFNPRDAQPSKEKVLDIDYYEKENTVDEVFQDDEVIVLNKGKKRGGVERSQVKPDLNWKDAEKKSDEFNYLEDL